jgi:RNA polymerase sigma-70 factor (ECF subfamily)
MGREEASTGSSEAHSRSAGKDAPRDFAAQFNSSFRVLWLVAIGIVSDASAAEDVVQEAALLALEKLDQFQPGTNFRAWMAQMVRFVALNHARRRQKHKAVTLEDASSQRALSTETPPAGGELQLGKRGQLPPDQAHFDDRVLAALNSVGEIPRSCLLLRTIEQLEYSEIAKVLDIPEGTAMSHVHRTRQYLRERLADLERSVLRKGSQP